MDDTEYIKNQLENLSKDLAEIKKGNLTVKVRIYGKDSDDVALPKVLQTLIDRPMDSLRKAGTISDNIMKILTLLQFIVMALIAIKLFGGS